MMKSNLFKAMLIPAFLACFIVGSTIVDNFNSGDNSFIESYKIAF